MRIRSVLMAWVLVLATLAPAPARADDATRQRAADALDVTDRRIGLAENFVGANPSVPAQAELAVAQQEQIRAKSAFTATEYVIAVVATQSAREHADRAIAIVRNLPDPERVRAQVEHTREVLDRAHNRVDACDNPRARSMLRVALSMQVRAEDALTESRYLAALQLTMSARERVLKAMRLCNLDESLSESTGRALQRTDELLARALESLDSSSPPAVRDMLGRAQSIQAQARAEARLERYDSALRLTQSARSLAQRVLHPEHVSHGSEGR